MQLVQYINNSFLFICVSLCIQVPVFALLRKFAGPVKGNKRLVEKGDWTCRRWSKWSHSVLFPYSGNGVLIPSVPPVCWALYKNHTRDIPESKVWVPFGKCGNWGSKMTVRKSQTQTLKFIFNETRCIVSATSAREKNYHASSPPPRQKAKAYIFNEVLICMLLELLAHISRTPANWMPTHL